MLYTKKVVKSVRTVVVPSVAKIEENQMKLVKAYATWCQPCKGLTTLLNEIDHPLVEKMEELDVDVQIPLARKYGIRTVPTLLLVDENGEVVERLVGSQNKDRILNFLG